MGRALVIIGALLLAAGLLIWLFERTNVPIGRLPGDFVIRGKNSTFYFPLATSLLISLLLSLVFYFLKRRG